MRPTTRLSARREADLSARRRCCGWPRVPWAVLGAVSAGGVVGATARHAIAVAWPRNADEFPWATLLTNVSGCLLIGVLMVLATEVWPGHPLLRTFLGVGVLGGYTTFSTYAVDIQQLVAAGQARTGLAYLAGTVAAALAAVYAGSTATRLVTGVRAGDGR